MKTIMTIGALALLMTTGAALARDHGERMDFATLDADGSGEITAEDFALLQDQRFGEVDADGDGQVSRAEFLAHAAARAGERAGEMFDRMDADGDGVLSEDAIAARMGGGRRGGGMTRMLERFDTDNSGGISAEEFEAAQARHAERRGGHEGKRRH
jgi:Ca2+-binding EF-hand superfamily protein